MDINSNMILCHCPLETIDYFKIHACSTWYYIFRNWRKTDDSIHIDNSVINWTTLQVLLPIMEWEATAFGRPVLALVLIGSLALFPVVLIPSGPSMWLAGMIFGYGLGFLIIMVGTTIGMVLPYFIGLLFRERIHVRPLNWMSTFIREDQPLVNLHFFCDFFFFY